MKGFFAASSFVNKQPKRNTLSKCGSCGLYKTCFSPKMPVTGKGLKNILIVAEAPGELEDRKNTQLIGKAGKRLRTLLKELSIDLDRDCWKTNAVICRPPNNKTPSNEIIDCCSANLFKTIETLKPVCIILLGGVAIQSLIGTMRDEKSGERAIYMGEQIPAQQFNAWICPTYHPSYLLRMEDSLLERTTKEHLRIAISKAKNRPFKNDVPDYTKQIDILINKNSQVRAFMGDIIKNNTMFAFDYECNCLKPEFENSRIYSCSISTGKETIAFPWSDNIAIPMVLLLKSKVAKIAANMKFEHRWSKSQVGVSVRNWYWDTMLAAHVLDNRKGVTGLKHQAFVKFGINSYNDHIEFLLKSKNGRYNRIHEIDIYDLLIYNGMDSLLEYKLAKRQMSLFK